MKYSVKCIDVDGSSKYRYKSLAGAVAKFEEMVGPIANAIAEACCELPGDPPGIECFRSLRGVGDFGNVAIFAAADVEAIELAEANYAAHKAKAKPAAPADADDNFPAWDAPGGLEERWSREYSDYWYGPGQ